VAHAATPMDIGGEVALQTQFSHDLLVAARRWRARMNERLKTIGQTEARCAALSEIAGAQGGLVQRELSARLGVEEPTVVRLVDALAAQDWVERTTHGADRRAKVLSVKPAAQPVMEKAQQIVDQMQHELLADIDPQDLDTLVRVLQRLSEKLDQMRV
jgi:MarR family transcriptional regulator for hemolysin